MRGGRLWLHLASYLFRTRVTLSLSSLAEALWCYGYRQALRSSSLVVKIRPDESSARRTVASVARYTLLLEVLAIDPLL